MSDANASHAPTAAAPATPPLSKFEQYKLTNDGFDAVQKIFRCSDAGNIAGMSEDDVKLWRWFGLYQQKPNADGFFMLRIKIPGGQVSPAQLRLISEITEKYARGISDITTRQTIQLHWLRIEDIKPIFQKLETLGLFCQFACGDTPRNVVSCPLAGVSKDEILDASRDVVAVNEMYRHAGRELSNLPRKYKTSIGGCHLHCQQPQINDVAFFGVKRKSGETGYGLLVGGGLSDTPYYAQPMRVFIKPAQIVEVARAVAAVFRDYGYREKRTRARLKFLVADKGWQWTRDRIEEKLGYKLEHDDTIQHPASVHSDHMGVGEQRDGNFYVGIPIERGRWTSKQMLAVADLAERYGVGEKRIRLTNKQNAMILDVPKANVKPLTKALDDAGLPPHAHRLRDLLISCTGNQFCNLAVVETKARSGSLLRWLEENTRLEEPIMIAVVGCPNSCAQYQIADIGLTGCMADDPVRKNEKGKPMKVEGYKVLLGGQLGVEPKFGEEITFSGHRVPGDRVHLSIKSLIDAFNADRVEDETFAMWVGRTEPEKLQKLIIEPAEDPNAVPLPA